MMESLSSINTTTTTTTTTTTVSSADSGIPLAVIHAHILMEYLPVIVFTPCLCSIGIVGNVVTVIFYRRKLTKSSTAYLIAALALVDIVVCLLGILSVLDLCINVLFSERILCKATYLFDQWMILISVLILWIISIDRYIKLCRPYWSQFTIRRAKLAIIIVTIFSLVVSMRDLITYDVTRVNIDNLMNNSLSVTVDYCTTSPDAKLKQFIFYSHIFDICLVSIILITFSFTYSSIGYRLFKHAKYLKSSSVRPFNLEQDDSSFNSDIHVPNSNIERVSNDNSVHWKAVEERVRRHGTVVPPKTDENEHKRDSTLSTISGNGFTNSTLHMKQSERNVTSMMFAVSIGLVVCFAPYFIVSVTVRLQGSGKIEIQPWIQLAIRSPFLSSVINPILFTAFNPQYRRHLKRVLCRCCSVT